MCGIVGYVGERAALPILMEKLRKLTYRGYDSAGVAICSGGDLYVAKRAGKVAELESEVAWDIPGITGIGHTRWATHGPPTTINAHPHLDCHQRIAVVHNGIVENYETLKAELETAGHHFRSDTDSEILAHLLEAEWHGSLPGAMEAAMRRVAGACAIVAMCADEPDQVVAAKLDNPPLILGLGRGENHLASDIPSLLQYTNKVYALEDGEIAVVTRTAAKVWAVRAPTGGRIQERALRVVEWSSEQAEKGGYPHYMLKEIHEQPAAVRETLRGRLDTEGRVALEGIGLRPEQLAEARRLVVVACGTAYHAGLVAKRVFEPYLELPVEVDVASEYRYGGMVVGPGDVVLAISQSGETADTLACVREAQARGAAVVAITNVVGSSIARAADHIIFTRAGPEIAVASTKAFMTQLVAIYLLAAFWSQEVGRPVPELTAALWHLPDAIEKALGCERRVEEVAERLSRWSDSFFIGRGVDEAIAREGALKLKEISYIHAEAYAAGELKHGTLALISEGVPVIAVATQSRLYEKMASNIQEVMARAGWVIGVVREGDNGAAGRLADVVRVPSVLDAVMPAVTVVPLQLLAYHCAVLRGCDVDQPRNLAKSVTVE